ncbi:MAG: DtxR family Mn-dependent transcriptional regulator [Halobacteriales archaeon]
MTLHDRNHHTEITTTMATATTIDSEIPVSPGEGRYLCGILSKSLRGDPPVTNGALAASLDVSGASVSEMIEGFDDRELVSYAPYEGAELTEEGERVARMILWRRCTVQQFFEDEAAISLTDDQAYRIANELEAEDLRTLGHLVGQDCVDRCEATDVSDCEGL